MGLRRVGGGFKMENKMKSRQRAGWVGGPLECVCEEGAFDQSES